MFTYNEGFYDNLIYYGSYIILGYFVIFWCRVFDGLAPKEIISEPLPRGFHISFDFVCDDDYNVLFCDSYSLSIYSNRLLGVDVNHCVSLHFVKKYFIQMLRI